MTKEKIVVIGYGPVGAATAERLIGAGYQVTVAQRSQPTVLPAGVDYVRCDVLDPGSVVAAVAGHDQVVVAIGLPYDGALWLRDWPAAMHNMLRACEAADARMVFVDDLYMYGPQDRPLVETMPLTDYGRKPRARAEVTRLWRNSTVRVAALRVTDFYGPGVRLSHLGDVGFARVAKGQAAMLIVPPDLPHDFAFVPDVARAIETLLEAPDDVFGQAWHMPCAPIMTPGGILAAGARASGREPKVRALPLWLVALIGWFSAPMREMAEMRFLWDRPYHVDASKWRERFWSDVTPFEVGAAATLRSFQ